MAPEDRISLSRAAAARAERRFEEALAIYEGVAEGAGGSARAADALRGAGICLLAMSRWDEAKDAYEASLETAEALEDATLVGKAFNGLAAVEFERGDWFFARRMYREARRHAREAQDRLLLAQVENNEGAMLAARGDPEAAEESFRRALNTFEDLESNPCATRTLNNLGLVLTTLRRFVEAETVYDRALRETARQGDRLFGIVVSVNRARLELERDRAHLALSLAREALDLAREVEYGPAEAGALCLMGEVSLELADLVGATRFLHQALEASAERKAPLVEAETWTAIARLYVAQNDLPRAMDTYRHAQTRYRELGAGPEAERIHRRIEELRESLPADVDRGFAVA